MQDNCSIRRDFRDSCYWANHPLFHLKSIPTSYLKKGHLYVQWKSMFSATRPLSSAFSTHSSPMISSYRRMLPWPIEKLWSWSLFTLLYQLILQSPLAFIPAQPHVGTNSPYPRQIARVTCVLWTQERSHKETVVYKPPRGWGREKKDRSKWSLFWKQHNLMKN